MLTVELKIVPEGQLMIVLTQVLVVTSYLVLLGHAEQLPLVLLYKGVAMGHLWQVRDTVFQYGVEGGHEPTLPT